MQSRSEATRRGRGFLEENSVKSKARYESLSKLLGPKLGGRQVQQLYDGEIDRNEFMIYCRLQVRT